MVSRKERKLARRLASDAEGLGHLRRRTAGELYPLSLLDRTAGLVESSEQQSSSQINSRMGRTFVERCRAKGIRTNTVCDFKVIKKGLFGTRETTQFISGWNLFRHKGPTKFNEGWTPDEGNFRRSSSGAVTDTVILRTGEFARGENTSKKYYNGPERARPRDIYQICEIGTDPSELAKRLTEIEFDVQAGPSWDHGSRSYSELSDAEIRAMGSHYFDLIP